MLIRRLLIGGVLVLGVACSENKQLEGGSLSASKASDVKAAMSDDRAATTPVEASVLADKQSAEVTAQNAGELSPVTGDIQAGIAALDKSDFALAAREFAMAFEKGEGDGAFYLGRMYETGMGAPANVAQAVQIYRAGIEKDSRAALNRLGVMHLEGIGVLQDFTEGAKLICEAADKGDVNAEFNCGTLYMDGKGLEADSAKAVSYFQKAASKDHIAASNFLGLSYLTGKGLPANETKAILEFKKTAERGNLLGMVHLGKHYADEGEKGHRDLVLSHMYFNLAASSGHPTAAANRDQVQTLMTNEQITKAQKRAREWTPKAP